MATNDVFLRPDAGDGTNGVRLRPDAADAGGVTGTIAWTEALDTWAITGAITTSGLIAWTEAEDVWSIVGTLTGSGALAWTEANDTWSIQGSAQSEAVFYSGGWIPSDKERRRRIRAERIRLGIIEEVVEDTQAEERAAYAFIQQLQAGIAQAQARQEATAAETVRLMREADRAATRKRLKALRAQAADAKARIEALRGELDRIQVEHSALLVEIEELDVAFVAAVLANLAT